LQSLPTIPALPASPAQVTDLVERQTHLLSSTVSTYVARTNVSSSLSTLRTNLSSPLGIQATVLLLEAYGLQSRTLPWRHAFTLPFLPLPKLLGGGSVRAPDFFALLDARAFWGPSLLWVLTSLLLPMVAGWFFNLSAAAGRGGGGRARAYRVDPLAFNVAKALMAWLVFEKGATLGGLVSRASVDVVESALPGGYKGVLVSSAIGSLGALYEAALARR